MIIEGRMTIGTLVAFMAYHARLLSPVQNHPRSLPGVPRARNLHGISFAVANATGFVVRACEQLPSRSYRDICEALASKAGATPNQNETRNVP